MEERYIDAGSASRASAAGEGIAMEGRPFQSGVLGRSPLLSETEPRGEQQAMVSSTMAASLAGLFILMLLLLVLLLVFVLACRPWRFFCRRRTFTSSSFKGDDIERPLFSENFIVTHEENHALAQNSAEESSIEVDGHIYSPKTLAIVGNVSFPRKYTKKRISANFQINTGDSLSLDVPSDASEDIQIGQTLTHGAISISPHEGVNYVRRKDGSRGIEVISDKGKSQISAVRDVSLLRSGINLEVIAGPSAGLCCSRYSTDTAILPLTLGRVSPSDLILQDSEVSGKHAFIDWNTHKSKWELVDMGSLNGTFLNSKAIHHPVAGSRQCSEPVELSSGDIITLGSRSKICVQIRLVLEQEPAFGVGIASDPMAMRRGGKKLPMEDMCFCKWPLPGVEQFGLFSIFDGHGGAGAARAASRLLPQIMVDILSNTEKKERVFSLCDAADVLKEAFALTEAALNHQYEGCTATVLLVWFVYNEVFAQCANVGDSACILNVNGKDIMMTEDHRVSSILERTRLNQSGKPLEEGETRLFGLNLGRMLGDKFLKEQEKRFSADPYVSRVVHITKGSTAFGLMASDGLWDVISAKRAVQLIIQAKETYYDAGDANPAEKIANHVLSEARTLRTKDNTSVIFLDFDLMRTDNRKLNF